MPRNGYSGMDMSRLPGQGELLSVVVMSVETALKLLASRFCPPRLPVLGAIWSAAGVLRKLLLFKLPPSS